jgi:hypothetical protein
MTSNFMALYPLYYVLTAWRRILPEKLIVAQIVKNPKVNYCAYESLSSYPEPYESNQFT